MFVLFFDEWRVSSKIESPISSFQEARLAVEDVMLSTDWPGAKNGRNANGFQRKIWKVIVLFFRRWRLCYSIGWFLCNLCICILYMYNILYCFNLWSYRLLFDCDWTSFPRGQDVRCIGGVLLPCKTTHWHPWNGSRPAHLWDCQGEPGNVWEPLFTSSIVHCLPTSCTWFPVRLVNCRAVQFGKWQKSGKIVAKKTQNILKLYPVISRNFML